MARDPPLDPLEVPRNGCHVPHWRGFALPDPRIFAKFADSEALRCKLLQVRQKTERAILLKDKGVMGKKRPTPLHENVLGLRLTVMVPEQPVILSARGSDVYHRQQPQ